jgi:hypothetical protein
VDSLGNQFFPGSRFAGNRYGDIGAASFFQQRKYLAQSNAGSDNTFFEFIFFGDLFFEMINLPD